MKSIYELGYKITVYAMDNWKFGASPDEFGESISYNIHLLYALKNNELLSTEDWGNSHPIMQLYEDAINGGSDALELILEIDKICNSNIMSLYGG